MKAGSKYYPLFEHLQRCQKDLAKSQLSMSFAEIERLLKKPLPASAAKRAWWSNRDTASALQSGAWVQTGYHVKSVDFEARQVIFTQFQADYTISRKGDAILWDSSAIKALRKHMELTQAKFAEELGVRRQTVSEWENGVYEPDRSTAKHLELIAKQKDFES